MTYLRIRMQPDGDAVGRVVRRRGQRLADVYRAVGSTSSVRVLFQP